MIKTFPHNGINFSDSIARKSDVVNFDAQRKLDVINAGGLSALAFEVSSDEGNALIINNITNGENEVITPSSATELATSFIVFYEYLDLFGSGSLVLSPNSVIYFEVQSGIDKIFSEYYQVRSSAYCIENDIVGISAYNSNSKRGFATESTPAFGFFKISKLKHDVFLNEKVEYTYSYNRKKVLSSENAIAKRFTFLDLTMYQANLLKWLCNCETLKINGAEYQLISEFTEVEADPNSEIVSLQADFVAAEHSFAANPNTELPNFIFDNKFFIK